MLLPSRGAAERGNEPVMTVSHADTVEGVRYRILASGVGEHIYEILHEEWKEIAGESSLQEINSWPWGARKVAIKDVVLLDRAKIPGVFENWQARLERRTCFSGPPSGCNSSIPERTLAPS